MIESISFPEPQACDLTKLTCNFWRSLSGILVSHKEPNPVLIP